MNSMKPKLIKPSTAITRPANISGRCLLRAATATPQNASITTHSNMEPSWAPQVAETRYNVGNAEFELFAT